MLGVLLRFRLLSVLNAARARAARLRQPRYLIGAAAAGAYVYFFILRNLHTAALRVPDPDGWGGALAVAGLMAGAALVWIFPGFGPTLRLSPAEGAFLLPAPIRRRTLVHDKLLASQGAVAFSALLMALVGRRLSAGGEPLVLRIAGCWIALSVVYLHSAAVHLCVRLRRMRGERTAALRGAAVGVIGLYAAAVAGAAGAAGAAAAAPGAAPFGGAGSGALFWLLLPIRTAFGPLLAANAGQCLRALPGAGLVLALHYAWIIRSGDALREDEPGGGEGSAAGTRSPAPTAARELFRLAPQGSPEIAFLWKNLLSMGSGLASRRTARVVLILVGLGLLIVRASIGAGAGPGGRQHGPEIAAGAALVAFYTLLAGPQFARQDLRGDFPQADLLKSYPLEGWRIALGELLAPTLLLSSILWVVILTAAVGVTAENGGLRWMTPGVRIVGALCLGTAAPFACLIQLLAPNALMLLFPGWHQASRTRGGGIEAMGQRIVFAFAQLALAVVAFGPAAAAASLFAFASEWVAGPSGALLAGTAAALAILGIEGAVGLWFLGWRLEALDLSAEPH